MYITLREGLEFSVILLLLVSIYREHKYALIFSAVAAIAAGIFMTGISFPVSGFIKKVYVGFMFYSFLLVLVLSLVSDKKVIYPVAALVLMLSIPSAQLASVVMEDAALKGSSTLIFAIAGLAAAGAVFAVLLRLLPRVRMERFFGTDGIMVFLAAFCFAFGGLREFDHSSIITSLQKGLYIFISSFSVFLKKTLLIPDGGLVSAGSDMLFVYLSSQRVAMAVTALLLFIPPLLVFIRLLFVPEPETAGIVKKADKRKVISVHINELIRKGTPVLAALLIIIVQLHAANIAIRPTYEPDPLPVITEDDIIQIPLVDKLGDISDGRMRKYAFRAGGETFRFFAMVKPDGDVVAVLDACEICPPRGYVQRGEHVICKYCNTPIPVSTLGQPGGCNPIPVTYRVENDTLFLSRSDIISAYREKAGKETGSLLR
jgi:uncharacterized membrane protein